MPQTMIFVWLQRRLQTANDDKGYRRNVCQCLNHTCKCIVKRILSSPFAIKFHAQLLQVSFSDEMLSGQGASRGRLTSGRRLLPS